MEDFKVCDLVQCISKPGMGNYQIEIGEQFVVYKINRTGNLLYRHPRLEKSTGECFHKRHFKLVEHEKYTTLIKGVL